MKGTKPTKILVGGDRSAAERFIGPANSQMEILKKQMSFQNRSQGVRRVWLHDDVYVECIKCFNYQECKIWVRPVVLEEEAVSEEGYPVYFYVHMMDDFLFGYGEGPLVDRIIIWRIRNMDEDGKTIPGDGNDGTGLVLYDVDLENGEPGDGVVYTNIDAESGGDGTAEENAAVIELIKKYKKQITGESFNPGNYFNTWFLPGATLGNPSKAWEYSACCNENMEFGVAKSGTLKLNECFTDSAGNKYWHIVDTPPFEELVEGSEFYGASSILQNWIYDNVCSQDFVPGGSAQTNNLCQNLVSCGLEDEYNSTEWTNLDTVAEEYGEFVYPGTESGMFWSCEGECVKYNPEHNYSYLSGECYGGGASGSNIKMIQSGIGVGSHKNSEFKFSCFFFALLEPSRAENSTGYAIVDYYVWEDSWGSCPPSDMHNYMDSYHVANYKRTMPSEIMTPLETISLEENLVQSVSSSDGTLYFGDGSPEQPCSLSEVPLIGHVLSKYASLGVGATGIFGNLSNWYHPMEFAPDLLPLCKMSPNPEVGYYCSPVEVSCLMHQEPVEIFDGAIPKSELIKDHKRYVSLFFIHDRVSGHETDTYGISEQYSWKGYGYSFVLFIYIIEPDFFRRWNKKTEVYEFWDIHSEKEEDPEEINKYRAIGDEAVPSHDETTTVTDYVVDLEEYVAQAVMDIRDTDAYRQKIYDVSGNTYLWPLMTDFDTGFVFQLPLKMQ